MSEETISGVVLSRADLTALRQMIRLLSVQRLLEVTQEIRASTDVTDVRFVTEVLRYVDIHRVYDHHLLSTLELAQAQSLESIGLTNNSSSLDFYRAVLNQDFAGIKIDTPIFTEIVSSCRLAQPELRRKFSLGAEAAPGLSANVPTAPGVN